MSRSRSFTASLARYAREAERANRQRIRDQQAHERDILRRQRETERAARAFEKDQRKVYLEDRIAETEEKNQDLAEELRILDSVLIDGLRWNPRVAFDALRTHAKLPSLNLSGFDKAASLPMQLVPAKPFWLWRWIPFIRRIYEADLKRAAESHAEKMRLYDAAEQRRKTTVAEKQRAHVEQCRKIQMEVDSHNQEIDTFESTYRAGEPQSVAAYAQLVLASSPLPESFPRIVKAVYEAASKQLVVESDLPTFDDTVPLAKAFKYVKATDQIAESPRPDSQRRSIYSSIVAQAVIRSLREIFLSDVNGFIETVVFNGHVDTIDRGTGKRVHPCIVTVRTSRDAFNELDLAHVEATACLKTLNAGVSKSPAELVPVRPILEFKMFDPRFVQEADVLSTLDQRTNLMDLSPGEFESLITNLFQSMGLETKLTQASRDGGVDCVAYDPRPIFGGKVIIQAKRYKNTVGVSSVRDLFGTMQNEGASKGILVTTSGFGKASFEFAANKPIELLAGSNLLYLLSQHAGLDAKIVMPEDWKDSAPDS